MSAYLVFNQFGDFSLIGKSSSCNIVLGVDHLAIALYREDTAATLDQGNL